MKSVIDVVITVFAVVAPLAGAWIEISLEWTTNGQKQTVAPLAGAWIEIMTRKKTSLENLVAPLVGAWIEICNEKLEGKVP